ncbi:3-oxoadipate enol-lactonase [Nocardiopsis chromatogenes]|uniref:3-oxoadipate enol-lactonase n=1 Tax=Nocardiopsis chromatogenes TaxID=280239 RepID=UPI00034DEBDD|nr:3-oxoadipate enol-lactonase [Nocardiopsis chromatogenes]
MTAQSTGHPIAGGLHAVDSGPDGAPAVVLAGSLGSTLEMWDPQAEALTAAGLRVVRFDHRGHGRSPVPDGPTTIADLGADVLDLLDRLGLDRVGFTGLSLGGMVGMWLAANAPERIGRLALMCTAAWLGPPENWTDRAATVRAHGAGAVAEAVVGRWFTPGYAAANPDEAARMRRTVASTPAEGYAACCEAIAAMDLRADLGRITAPTLVVAGAHDPATPPEHAERIARAVPGARRHVLDGGAHLANRECADEVNRLLVAHFA